MSKSNGYSFILERIRKNGSQFTVPFYVKEAGKDTYKITYSLKKALRILNEEEAKDIKKELKDNCVIKQAMARR